MSLQPVWPGGWCGGASADAETECRQARRKMRASSPGGGDLTDTEGSDGILAKRQVRPGLCRLGHRFSGAGEPHMCGQPVLSQRGRLGQQWEGPL